jgi:cell division transport system permease protein
MGMQSVLKRALSDIRDNGFINLVAALTIAFSVIICGAFLICWTNVNRWIDDAHAEVRVMVYLQAECSADQTDIVFKHIRGISGVSDARFVSRDQAMTDMKVLMKNQTSLLDGLRVNPFPDYFEIRLKPDINNPESISAVAAAIGSIPGVENVEYGQQWIERFAGMVQAIQLIGYALITLFFMASAFIVANTARLVFLSKQEEIEVMRLVGATDRFISSPIYMEGVIQGAVGGLLGLGLLFGLFLILSSRLHSGTIPGFFSISFLPVHMMVWILVASMIAGWIGCLIAVRPFLRA